MSTVMAVILGVDVRTIAQVQGNVFVDSDHELAKVSVQQDEILGFTVFTFHPDAYEVFAYHGKIAEIMDHVEPLGDGTHMIPASVCDPEVAEDVNNHLDYIETYPDMRDAEDGQCVLPTCLQDGVDRKRGFLLCLDHATALQDWDDLVAMPV